MIDGTIPKSEKSLRFNQGKTKWSLVDFKSIESLPKVLEFGKDKYTTIDINKLNKFLNNKCYVKIVREIGKLELDNYAILAMKQNCLILIPKEENELDNIKKTIGKLTETNFVNFIEIEKLKEKKTLNTDLKKEMNITDINTGYQQKKSILENQKVVNYVENLKAQCIQTITIKQENSEVSFAVSATTGLDSSMMILQCLEKLLNISLDDNFQQYLITGRDNWKKGLDLKEILDSMSRHLFALMDGQINDPESGLPHTGHIMCNAMFFEYHLNKLMNKSEKEDDEEGTERNIKI